MKNTAALTRGTVAACLVACAVLTVVSVLLMPDFSGGEAAWLKAIAAAPTASAVSALLYAGSQLPFAVGLAGVAHLLRERTPVLAALGAVLAVLGGFGHAVYGGVNLVMLRMADDPASGAAHVEVLKGVGSGVAVPFMVNRPGSGGGIDPTEGWSHASTEEVPAGVAGACDAAGAGGS